MKDLELARQRLTSGDLNLVVVKEGETLFDSRHPRLKGLLSAIEECGEMLEVASLADRVVGRADAFLCVYALTMSGGGVRTLDEYNVPHGYEKGVRIILNQSRTDVCPFEKLVAETDGPTEAYDRLASSSTP
ncbi:MAG: DUF1893 domain-containing protein [Candidatus Geothermarchaeales archaeon]